LVPRPLVHWLNTCGSRPMKGSVLLTNLRDDRGMKGQCGDLVCMCVKAPVLLTNLCDDRNTMGHGGDVCMHGRKAARTVGARQPEPWAQGSPNRGRKSCPNIIIEECLATQEVVMANARTFFSPLSAPRYGLSQLEGRSRGVAHVQARLKPQGTNQ
jgi:hypothetical protein